MVGTAQPLCLFASGTEGRRYDSAMNLRKRKTHSISSHYWGWMARPFLLCLAVVGEAFVLTSPFIERGYRNVAFQPEIARPRRNSGSGALQQSQEPEHFLRRHSRMLRRPNWRALLHRASRPKQLELPLYAKKEARYSRPASSDDDGRSSHSHVKNTTS